VQTVREVGRPADEDGAHRKFGRGYASMSAVDFPVSKSVSRSCRLRFSTVGGGCFLHRSTDPAGVRKRIGYVAQTGGAEPSCTVVPENLPVRADLCRLDRKSDTSGLPTQDARARLCARTS
jgi:hypothetical protein